MNDRIDDIEQLIAGLFRQAQMERDENFAAKAATIARLRSSMIEAAEFGRDFRHLIAPVDLHQTRVYETTFSAPQSLAGSDDNANSWAQTFGREPGSGDPRAPGENFE
jgi:hypothetical protein